MATSSTINTVQEACTFITDNGATWQRIEITNCPLTGGTRDGETTAHVTSEKRVVKVTGLTLTEPELCVLLEASLESEPAELRMDHVDVGERVCELIAKRLETHATLLSLALTNCKLTDGGLALIAEALKVDRSLGSLDVSDNRISAEGAMALYKAMPAEPTLRSVDLSDNPCEGEAIRLLEKVIKYFTCTFMEEED